MAALRKDQSDASFAKSLGIEGTGPAALNAQRKLPAETIVGDLNMKTLAAAGLMFSGNGECNRIAGSYKVEGMQIKFSQGISTRMACIDNDFQI